MASTAKALLLSRFSDLSLQTPQSSISRQNLIRPFHLSTTTTTTKKPSPQFQRSSYRPAVVNCIFSGVDGGGVADEFVSTRKSGFDREFSVIGNMLKRIEPLDTSVISKGVTSAAKDSMKKTISTMLGLLPSDQFSVTIRVSKGPLDRLLASSIITGYTLWNAEYRVSLMRNFDISPGSKEASVYFRLPEGSDNEFEKREGGDGVIDGNKLGEELVEKVIPQSLGDLSPEALDYINKLKSELAAMEKELNAQKQENMQMEYKEENNDLLGYLRSLDPDMVTELSRPSSSEVEEIIHQLVQNILRRFYKDDPTSGFFEDPIIGKTESYPGIDVDPSDTIGTTRDYLAKLLFWIARATTSSYTLAGHSLVSKTGCNDKKPVLNCARNIAIHVYAIGSSLEKLGEQIAPELCCWIVVK
ncbi:Protein of unknown function DUF760 [Macleaya cordata]|uniref:Uncharacterized protein n=1 Tax=Macleaya cordata TaxID=56857 RepID=A0A200QF97_MACCD|nr:Protein of unknown function DUF760 [Macleaya cordata]